MDTWVVPHTSTIQLHYYQFYCQLLYNKRKTMLILETFQIYGISPNNLFFQDQENEYKGGPLEVWRSSFFGGWGN